MGDFFPLTRHELKRLAGIAGEPRSFGGPHGFNSADHPRHRIARSFAELALQSGVGIPTERTIRGVAYYPHHLDVDAPDLSDAERRSGQEEKLGILTEPRRD